MIKKLGQWKIYEVIPSKSTDFFKELIEVTINRRRNGEQVNLN